jgi:hypothetical protein
MIDLIRKTKNRPLFKMAENDDLFLACSAIRVAAAGAINVLITENRKRKHSAWVKKCIRE